MSKKLTSLVIAGALILSLGIGTITAFAASDAQANREAALAQAQSMTRHEALVEMANATGINITGLSDDEIDAALGEKKREITGFTSADETSDEEAIANREAALAQAQPMSRHEALVEMANAAGIDIAGLSDDEIDVALGEKKLNSTATTP